MKILLILICILLASCSSLSDIEGLGKTGEVLRTMDSSCKRLYGRSCDSKPLLNAPQINRTVGQAKQVPYHISTKNVPIIMQEVQILIPR